MLQKTLAETPCLQREAPMTSIEALLAELDRQTEVARRERQAAVLRLAERASGAGDALLREVATQHPWSLLASAATGGAVLSNIADRGPIRTALMAVRSALLLGLGVARCSPAGEHPEAGPDLSTQAQAPARSSAQ